MRRMALRVYLVRARVRVRVRARVRVRVRLSGVRCVVCGEWWVVRWWLVRSTDH